MMCIIPPDESSTLVHARRQNQPAPASLPTDRLTDRPWSHPPTHTMSLLRKPFPGALLLLCLLCCWAGLLVPAVTAAQPFKPASDTAKPDDDDGPPQLCAYPDFSGRKIALLHMWRASTFPRI